MPELTWEKEPAMTDTAVRAGQTSGSTAPHPLEPATAAEYLAGRDVMAAAGLLAGPVRFAYYGLEEPPKHEVLDPAAPAADRRLRAFLINTETGESTDVVVSLTGQKVVSARVVDTAAEGQLPIMDGDFALVDEIVKADPGWRAASDAAGCAVVDPVRLLPKAKGAAVMVRDSKGANDGWFWGSAELDQHLACGVFRAVECRKPLLVAANTGFSAWIDADGRIRSQAGRQQSQFLIAEPRLDDRQGCYVNQGDWLAGICLTFSLGLALVALLDRKRKGGPVG